MSICHMDHISIARTPKSLLLELLVAEVEGAPYDDAPLFVCWGSIANTVIYRRRSIAPKVGLVGFTLSGYKNWSSSYRLLWYSNQLLICCSWRLYKDQNSVSHVFDRVKNIAVLGKQSQLQ